jgi:pimeloyl-ACP methyl ester carboxylesterase
MLIKGMVLLVIVVIGYISGNQPKRDAVDFAQKQLGITLENRQVIVGEISLNVVFAGPKDGEPVVLLHGYPEFWYAWRGPMVELAKAGFRVIVPDQRGYNDSDKPARAKSYRLDILAGDIAGLITALGYDEAYLSGHDFGGLVAWWTLILHPEKITKFVVFNKPHPEAIRSDDGKEEKISWYRTFLRVPWIPGYFGRLANWFLLVKNLQATSLPGTFPKEHMQQLQSAWDNNGAINSMGAWYRANANFEMTVDNNISTPGLFVLAPDDAFSSKSMALKSMQYIENGRLLELTEGTHWLIQEKPKLVGNILIEFFKNK